jgi:hypothetical protein
MKNKIFGIVGIIGLLLIAPTTAQVIIQGVQQFGASNFTGQSTFANGTAAAPSIASNTTVGNGIFFPSTTSIGFQIAGFSTTAPIFNFTSTNIRVAAGVPIGWTASADATAALDIGLSRTAAGTIAVGNGTQGDASGSILATNFTASGAIAIGAGNSVRFGGGNTGHWLGPSNGVFSLTTQTEAIGSQLKVDALPTVASGFGTSPAITAGSTPFAGSVNVGTGGVATSGIINFNGTAFPSAPHCVCNDTLTTLVQRCTGSTTQLTITSAAWTANDIIDWICVSSK